MLVSPLLDRGFVALTCPLNRLLPRPTQVTQDPSHVCRMVAHTELTLNHLTNAFSGPDIATKAMGFSAKIEQLRDVCQLLRRQTTLCTWCFATT